MVGQTTPLIKLEATRPATVKTAAPPRNQSLDALRGFAILAMVLSGAIAFGGVLPAWMYHAQVPPPAHKFIPTIPGITWVDLVFPFFLFSMGAAIPLSMAKAAQHGTTFGQVMWVAVRRFLLLAFFAFFTQHMRARMMAENPTTTEYLLSILSFGLLCFQFYQHNAEKYKAIFTGLRVVSFAAAAFLLWLLPFRGKGFQLTQVDIILLVLANMALFGTLIWWLTRRAPLLRVGLLLFVMAVFFGGKEGGTWNAVLYNWTPAPWLYKFYYLKYLFIVIPGTIAGEWLHGAAGEEKEMREPADALRWIGLLSFGLVACNVALLFSRQLVLNLGLTTALGICIYYLLERKASKHSFLRKFWSAGFYLLLLGLFFEAYEGGIKKDFSTYSYYFVSSGLAFFMLIGFSGLATERWGKSINQHLSLNGRNPMVAYVAGNLLLTPVLHLTGAITIFEAMNGNAWAGFLKGVIFTAIVSLVTIFFTKKKWFWKT